MLRYVEIGFFLVPFALYAAWRVLGTRATSGLVWATIAMVAALAATTVWYGLDQGLPRGVAYVPAQLHGDEIVPGHGR